MTLLSNTGTLLPSVSKRHLPVEEVFTLTRSNRLLFTQGGARQGRVGRVGDCYVSSRDSVKHANLGGAYYIILL